MQKDLIANLPHQAVQEMLKVWFLQEKYPNFDPADNPKEHVAATFWGLTGSKEPFSSFEGPQRLFSVVFLYLFMGTKFPMDE
jgi:hypothetical protein